MALARGNPKNFFDKFNEQLTELIPRSTNDNSDSNWSLSDWLPKTDIFGGSDDDLVFEIEAPGFDRDDLNIEVKNNNLIVRGERSREETEEDEDRNYYRKERRFGSFQRTFPLPSNADVDDITASYDDGMLKISMPAPETSDQDSIEIT